MSPKTNRPGDKRAEAVISPLSARTQPDHTGHPDVDACIATLAAVEHEHRRLAAFVLLGVVSREQVADWLPQLDGLMAGAEDARRRADRLAACPPDEPLHATGLCAACGSGAA